MITTETVAAKDTAALIVFGQPSKGGQHAAWFTAGESASARKAATLRSLAVLEPVPDGLTDVLPKIARGKFVMGQLSLSKATPDVYKTLLTQLQAANRAKQAEAETAEAAQTVKQPDAKGDPSPASSAVSAPTPAPSVLPAPTPAPAKPPTRPGAEAWEHLKAGDIVLAPYGTSADGWWEARVVAIEGDTCRLVWCDGSAALKLYRFQIGLFYPKP